MLKKAFKVKITKELASWDIKGFITTLYKKLMIAGIMSSMKIYIDVHAV